MFGIRLNQYFLLEYTWFPMSVYEMGRGDTYMSAHLRSRKSFHDFARLCLCILKSYVSISSGIHDTVLKISS
jgi:hypothetical protein